MRVFTKWFGPRYPKLGQRARLRGSRVLVAEALETRRLLAVDTLPPITIAPPDVTLEAPADTSPAVTGFATVSDDQDPDPTATFSDIRIPTACRQQFTLLRIWTGMDDAGNISTALQTISVVDTTSPVIIAPPDVTVTLGSDTEPPATGFASAVDAADPEVSVSYEDATLDGSSVGSFTILRTWTATDDCGNSSSAIQSIFVVAGDTTPPVITLNGPDTIVLEAGVEAYIELGAIANDETDGNVPVLIGGDTVDASTVGTYIVTYDAVDAAGNQAERVERTVIVEDTIPPTVEIISSIAGDGRAISDGGFTFSRSIEFAFESDEESGVTFEVSLDGGAFVGSLSPQEYAGLSLGDHSFAVRATDAAGNTSTAVEFQWRIITATEAIGGLIGDVKGLDLGKGTEKSLVKKLSGAFAKLSDGKPQNDSASVGKLQAFIRRVEAARGKQLDDGDADALIARTMEIIDQIVNTTV